MRTAVFNEPYNHHYLFIANTFNFTKSIEKIAHGNGNGTDDDNDGDDDDDDEEEESIHMVHKECIRRKEP